MATDLGVAYLSVSASTGGLTKDIRGAFGGAEGIARTAGQKAGKGYLGGFAMAGAVAGIASTLVSGLASGIGQLAGEAVAASDATDKFKSSLNFAGLKGGAIEEATKGARAYADQTVYDLADIQNTSAQLASNGIKNYGDLTMAAGNLNAVAGGNAQTFKSVGMVLTQTAGAGKLTTENWNQLADAIPGASGQIQAALKKNGAFTGNFRDAMAKGQISATEFNKVLLELGSKPVAVEAAKSTKTFEGAIGNLKATIVGGLSDGLNAIKPALTGTITLIANGLGGGIDLIKAGIPNVQEFFKSFAGSGGAGAIAGVLTLLSPMKLVLEAIMPILPQLATTFGGLGSQLAATLLPVLAKLAPVIGQVVAALSGGLQKVILALLPALMQVASAVLPVLAEVIAAIVPVVLQLVQAFLPFVDVAASLITSLLPPLASLILQLVPILMPLVGAVMSVVQAFMPMIGVVLQLVQTLLPPLMAVLNALIPVIVWVASTLTGQMVGGLRMAASFISALIPVISSLIGWVGNVAAAIANWVAGAIPAIGSFVSTVSTKIGEAIAWFAGLPGRVMGALSGLGSLLVSSGRNLVDGFLRGIKGAWDTLVGWVKGAMENLRGLWPFSPAKWGPFSGHGYVTYSGQALGEDFAASLRAQQPNVRSAALGLMGAAAVTPSRIPDMPANSASSSGMWGGPLIGQIHAVKQDSIGEFTRTLMDEVATASRLSLSGLQP